MSLIYLLYQRHPFTNNIGNIIKIPWLRSVINGIAERDTQQFKSKYVTTAICTIGAAKASRYMADNNRRDAESQILKIAMNYPMPIRFVLIRGIINYNLFVGNSIRGMAITIHAFAGKKADSYLAGVNLYKA